MIKYEYKKVTGYEQKKFIENGHTMFEEDVLQRLKRLAYLEEQMKQANGVNASEATAILPRVSNSLKAIKLTYEEAKHVNKVIRTKEDADGEIVGYLLEVLMKIEQQYPDIKS